MTLREWVSASAGIVASRDLLEQFETELLEGWAHAEEHAGLVTDTRRTLPAETWTLAFRYWYMLVHKRVQQ